MSAKKKTRRVVLAIAAALVAAATFFAVMISAAYYGKGMFKDVFLNGHNYFSSDILSTISRTDDIRNNQTASGGTQRSIGFYNYDLSTGEYNMFDITFSLYAWLADDSTGKTCTLTYGSETLTVDSAVENSTALHGLTLAGGKASTCTVTVTFTTNAEELSSAPTLYVCAIPDTPKYMAGKMLGAMIIPSLSDAFSVSCKFEYTDGARIEDYAAFLYAVSVIGEPPAGEKLKIRWNTKVLTLITGADHLPDGATITAEADTGYSYAEFTPTADTLQYFTFMRVQDLPEDETNAWENTTDPVTWESLATFVTYEMVVA